MKLGKLTSVELRKQWPTEPKFSDWLSQEENLAELSAALELELSFVRREEDIGKFKLDILAKEEGSESVVAIENQFNVTDHDHLGKLITYASGCEAKTVIWIVEKVDDEHQAAIKWLNANMSNGVKFFLVRVRLLQIGSSDIAPIFDVVEKPNEWQRDVKAQSEEMTKSQLAHFDFWSKFAEYAKNDVAFSNTFNPRKPSTDHWLNFACGSSSYHLALTIKGRDAIGVEIYMPDDKEQYESFAKSKVAIEKELGYALEWQPLPGKKAARIYYGNKINWVSAESQVKCFAWLAKTAVQMKTVFCKYAD